jgi:hypothetical protein
MFLAAHPELLDDPTTQASNELAAFASVTRRNRILSGIALHIRWARGFETRPCGTALGCPLERDALDAIHARDCESRASTPTGRLLSNTAWRWKKHSSSSNKTAKV